MLRYFSQLQQSQHFIPILSPEFLGSAACAEEILNASEKCHNKELKSVAIMHDLNRWKECANKMEEQMKQIQPHAINTGIIANDTSAWKFLEQRCFPDHAAYKNASNRFEDDFFGNCKLLIEVSPHLLFCI